MLERRPSAVIEGVDEDGDVAGVVLLPTAEDEREPVFSDSEPDIDDHVVRYHMLNIWIISKSVFINSPEYYSTRRPTPQDPEDVEICAAFDTYKLTYQDGIDRLSLEDVTPALVQVVHYTANDTLFLVYLRILEGLVVYSGNYDFNFNFKLIHLYL